MRKHKTDEEKVANAIVRLITNLELDIEQIGRYIGRFVSRVAYNRLRNIVESAEYEREQREHDIQQ